MKGVNNHNFDLLIVRLGDDIEKFNAYAEALKRPERAKIYVKEEK